MLPEAAIPFRIAGERALPGFLDASDVPWLRVLVEEIDRFRARPLRELLERLRQPLPCLAPYGKRRAATAVLLRLWRGEVTAAVPPEQARAILFAAAAEHGSRAAAVAASAAQLSVAPRVLESSLFADLPGERLVRPPDIIPSPQELALRTNQLIVRSMLFHARRVRIRAEGAMRALVRQSKLRGLLCSVTGGSDPVLDLSGPFTVFRHTLLYGRALGELVGFLPHCARFELRADCVLRGQELVLDLATGDPIFPAERARTYDSKLEERFARDLRKLAPDWDLVREPEPVPVGGALIFPDFLLRHRLRPERCFLVEVMGFWSPDYVTRKLACLAEARLSNLILCIDESRACSDGALPPDARVVRFRRRIDPAAVLAAATRSSAG